MAENADLEQLLLRLNPYMPVSKTGGKEFMRFDHGDVKAVHAQNFSAFNFETQDDPAYRLDWTWMFKGQARIIRRALRFRYCYPVQDAGGAMATDYMLIGYEGGGGP
jgi:hypothetical protein